MYVFADSMYLADGLARHSCADPTSVTVHTSVAIHRDRITSKGRHHDDAAQENDEDEG